MPSATELPTHHCHSTFLPDGGMPDDAAAASYDAHNTRHVHGADTFAPQRQQDAAQPLYAATTTHATGGRLCPAYVCHLCCTIGHHFTQCQQFRYDTVCFHSELNDAIYVYQAPWAEWASGAVTMLGIFRFVAKAMGLRQHQVQLVVDGVTVCSPLVAPSPSAARELLAMPCTHFYIAPGATVVVELVARYKFLKPGSGALPPTDMLGVPNVPGHCQQQEGYALGLHMSQEQQQQHGVEEPTGSYTAGPFTSHHDTRAQQHCQHGAQQEADGVPLQHPTDVPPSDGSALLASGASTTLPSSVHPEEGDDAEQLPSADESLPLRDPTPTTAAAAAAAATRHCPWVPHQQPQEGHNPQQQQRDDDDATAGQPAVNHAMTALVRLAMTHSHRPWADISSDTPLSEATALPARMAAAAAAAATVAGPHETPQLRRPPGEGIGMASSHGPQARPRGVHDHSATSDDSQMTGRLDREPHRRAASGAGKKDKTSNSSAQPPQQQQQKHKAPKAPTAQGHPTAPTGVHASPPSTQLHIKFVPVDMSDQAVLQLVAPFVSGTRDATTPPAAAAQPQRKKGARGGNRATMGGSAAGPPPQQQRPVELVARSRPSDLAYPPAFGWVLVKFANVADAARAKAALHGTCIQPGSGPRKALHLAVEFSTATAAVGQPQPQQALGKRSPAPRSAPTAGSAGAGGVAIPQARSAAAQGEVASAAAAAAAAATTGVAVRVDGKPGDPADRQRHTAATQPAQNLREVHGTPRQASTSSIARTPTTEPKVARRAAATAHDAAEEAAPFQAAFPAACAPRVTGTAAAATDGGGRGGGSFGPIPSHVASLADEAALQAATAAHAAMLPALGDVLRSGEQCCRHLLLASFATGGASGIGGRSLEAQQRRATVDFIAACVTSMQALVPPMPSGLLAPASGTTTATTATGVASVVAAGRLQLLAVRASMLAMVNQGRLLHLACLQLRPTPQAGGPHPAASVDPSPLSDAAALTALRLLCDASGAFAGCAIVPLPPAPSLVDTPLSVAAVEERAARATLTARLALLARQVFIAGLLVEAADPRFAAQCWQHAVAVAERLLTAHSPHTVALRRLLLLATAAPLGSPAATAGTPKQLLPCLFPHVDHFPACFLAGRVEVELYTLEPTEGTLASPPSCRH